MASDGSPALLKRTDGGAARSKPAATPLQQNAPHPVGAPPNENGGGGGKEQIMMLKMQLRTAEGQRDQHKKKVQAHAAELAERDEEAGRQRAEADGLREQVALLREQIDRDLKPQLQKAKHRTRGLDDQRGALERARASLEQQIAELQMGLEREREVAAARGTQLSAALVREEKARRTPSLEFAQALKSLRGRAVDLTQDEISKLLPSAQLLVITMNDQWAILRRQAMLGDAEPARDRALDPEAGIPSPDPRRRRAHSSDFAIGRGTFLLRTGATE